MQTDILCGENERVSWLVCWAMLSLSLLREVWKLTPLEKERERGELLTL